MILARFDTRRRTFRVEFTEHTGDVFQALLLVGHSTSFPSAAAPSSAISGCDWAGGPLERLAHRIVVLQPL